jgi:hypothetical protein
MDRARGDLKAVRRIISQRFMLQYIRVEIFSVSFKFFMGDTLKVVTNEKGEAVGEVLTIIC